LITRERAAASRPFSTIDECRHICLQAGFSMAEAAKENFKLWLLQNLIWPIYDMGAEA